MIASQTQSADEQLFADDWRICDATFAIKVCFAALSPFFVCSGPFTHCSDECLEIMFTELSTRNDLDLLWTEGVFH